MTGVGWTLLSLREREGREDRDLRVELLAASAASTAISSSSPSFSTSATNGVPENSEAPFEASLFLRFGGAGVASSRSSEVLRFRKAREPSKGSSSTIKVLKIECEPGLEVPRAAGSKSLVSLEAEDRLLATTSWSGSSACSTHVGHLHWAASEKRMSLEYTKIETTSLERSQDLPSSEPSELASRAHCRCAAGSVSRWTCHLL